MAERIEITKVRGKGQAVCRDCTALHPQATRSRARLHVRQTGHLVRFHVTETTVYWPPGTSP